MHNSCQWPDLAQMTLVQDHDTLPGYKQSLCELSMFLHKNYMGRRRIFHIKKKIKEGETNWRKRWFLYAPSPKFRLHGFKRNAFIHHTDLNVYKYVTVQWKGVIMSHGVMIQYKRKVFLLLICHLKILII